jgi:MoxR-like ATPase
MATIAFTAGPRAGSTFDIPETGVTIGRYATCGLVLDDPNVSNQHAEIRIERGAWTIVDLGSSNGTTVNGCRVKTNLLRDGDVVELGGSSFAFRDTVRQEPGAGAAAGAADDDLALLKQMNRRTQAIRDEVGKVIVGQKEVLDQILMCLIADGHALLIGLPGMAKTLMVRTIAQVLDLEFKRIQFTPDLMPSDITGTDVLEMNQNTGEKEFRFIKGPLFCNLLLGDEINRTPPKTQAALLEAMQEKRVTVGNRTYDLDQPFFVLATQNPIEQEGTYPLPEAQLDRFMFNIWVDYPLEHEEEEIVGLTTTGGLGRPQRILTRKELLQLQEVVRKIPVSRHVVKYAISLVRATRPEYATAPHVTRTYVSTGAGPRAGQYLVLAAKARAVLEGRIHVSCRDIRDAALPVLRHRILTNFAADSEGLKSTDVVRRLLIEIPQPSEDAYAAQAPQ